MKNINIHFIVILVLVFIVDLISQPQNQYISDANTVLLLHLNETSGDTVFDSSPYHNDGVINGNIPSEGKFYGGMQFPPNNTDIGIQLPDSPSLNITGPLTIEAFLKVDSYEQGGTFIIRHNEYQLTLGSFGSAGYLQFFKRFGNEWYAVSCEEQVPLNEWMHLAGVWDGDSMRIYINGRQPLQVTYPPATYTPIGQPILASYWGSVLQPSTTTYIDEIRISNVAREFNQGLVAYYPLNGNANDLSGNNNNGAIIGGVTPTEDRFGNPNSAMQFNGVDGYILVPNSSTLQSPTTGLTITAWMYLDGFNGQIEVSGIVSKTNTSDYGQYNFSYHAWDTPKIAYSQNGGTQGYVSYINALDFSTWYFVAVTYDGNTVTVYLNGNIVGTESIPGPIQPDDNPITIGLETPGQTEYLYGKLDDIRIYKRALSAQEITQLVTGIDLGNNNIVANIFSLYQNYPNPFNPATKISWQSPKSGHQTLKVFDVLGNEVVTLVDEFRNAGNYDVDFNAGKLSSGVYFYQLKVGNFIQTKKMILLR